MTNPWAFKFEPGKAPCKPHDLKYHMRIARLILDGLSCRRATIEIVAQIGGTERARAANFDRLYRNHLANADWHRDWYRAFPENSARQKDVSEAMRAWSEELERAEAREDARQWHREYWNRHR